jgi:GT2 family glycosyltransferase
MLTYGCLDYTKEALSDLLAQDVPLHVLVIVQPREGDETPRYMLTQNPDRVVALQPPFNLGVAGGWNLGLKTLFNIGAQEVLVTGNDARLRRDTYRRLAAEAGGCIFTAWTQTLAEMQRGMVGSPIPTPPQWNGEPDIGPAHLMRRWLYEAVGPYDEKFHPIYYEDVDWFHRVKLAGFRAAYRTVAVPCWHSDGGSRWFKVSQEADDAHHALFLACQARYVRKWGGLPPNEVFTVPFNGGKDE